MSRATLNQTCASNRSRGPCPGSFPDFPEDVMKRVADLKVKVFADGAELAGMQALYRQPYIKGFTTNPTLMHKAGIKDYRGFAKEVVAAIPDRPISFEVF